MPQQRAKCWVFTWNNYPENYREIIEGVIDTVKNDNIIVEYVCVGEEVGESGTPHLQGFCRCREKIGAPSQKLWQAHWEVCRHVDRAIEYCKKGEQSHAEWSSEYARGPNYGLNAVVWEHGEKGKSRGVQGKRTDLHAFREAVEAAFVSGETYTERDARNDFPDVAAKYPRFVSSTIRDFRPLPEIVLHALRPWQQELNALLNLPADDRQVVFVVDKVGNQGKSWFAKYYRSNHERVQLISPGKFADMAYVVEENTRVFFIDTPREKMEYFNYYFLEKLKDRDVFSTKYEPVQKEWSDCCHVVVLMNEMPDMGKLSADRYKIIEIN